MIRLLGQGGQAAVWLAHDDELDEPVAVKVFSTCLSATGTERLRREVRLGRNLEHPRLVRQFELIEADGQLAVVMQWMPGGTVAQQLRSGPLPIDDVLDVTHSVLEVLEYLHESDVVHRDIKPSNLLLDERGQVHVGDLGVARELETGCTITRDQTVLGTPAYMSPEQIRGERVGGATDLYALGVTLHRLLTGRLPFSSTSELEMAERHLNAPAPDVRRLRPDCPRWLGRYVRRLLEKNPRDRFPSAAEARRALLRRRTWLVPSRTRRLAAYALVATALLCVGGAAMWHWTDREAARVETLDNRLVGVDVTGDPVWELTFDSPIRDQSEVDLDGDGVAELVVTAWPGEFHRELEVTRSQVVVLNRRGHVLTRAAPEELVRERWPFPYPVALVPEITTVDIDQDGRLEIVVRCVHRTFYPSALIVYWPASDQWEPVLVHSGWINDVAVAGDNPGVLLFAGYNNQFGMLPVAGAVSLSSESQGQEALVIHEEAYHGDIDERLRWYTFLQPPARDAGGAAQIDLRAAGALRVTLGATQVDLDQFGNPTGSPAHGVDHSQERVAFLRQLILPLVQPARLAGDARHYRSVMTTLAQPLLEEPSYRMVLDLRTAEMAAQTGDLASAIAILEACRAVTPHDEVVFTLANLQAIAGDTEAAIAATQWVIRNGSTGRASYDAYKLLLDLLIEQGDREEFEHLARSWSRRTEDDEWAGLARALAARANLWWDTVSESDCSVRSWSYEPAGEALACLARWRLGATRPDDPERMKQYAAGNPDAQLEFRVARAAALLGLGDVPQAVSELSSVLELIDQSSRTRFAIAQLRRLAAALYVRTLVETGNLRRASAIADELRSDQLHNEHLPARILDEALATTATVP